MNDLLAIAPILLPLTLAAITATLWTNPRAQYWVTITGIAALFIVSGFLMRAVMVHGALGTELGGWPAPFGIVIVVDRLSAAMVMVAATLALACIVFYRAEASDNDAGAGFFPLFCGLLAGVNGAFTTGDIFNLYVWFEVMLICTLGLLVIGRTRAQIDAAVRYAVLNLFGTMMFLIGIGLLYGVAGSLNMADLGVVLRAMEATPALTAAAVLFLIAFGIKAAAFPLFFWLPVSYHTVPMTVAAIFAGLLTKVGVYAALRVFTLLFEVGDGALQQVFVWAAALTMVTGVLGAVTQWDVRRVLSFHIISQIGYMMVGIALAAPIAAAATVFYVIHNIIVKANLVLVAGAIARAGGSYDLKQLGGLMKSHPWLAVLFLVPAISLAGLPPLSGFWAKLMIIDASFREDFAWLAVVGLAVSFMTLMSMLKIWMEAFWKMAPTLPATPKQRMPTVPLPMVAATGFLGAITVAIGLMPEPLVEFAYAIGAELTDPTGDINSILANETGAGEVVGLGATALGAHR